MTNEQDKQFTNGSGGPDAYFHLRRPTRTAKVSPISPFQPRKVPSWGLWVMWALASGIAGFGLVLLRLAVSVAGPDEIWGAIFVFWVLAALLALVSAFYQWVVLHPYVRRLSPYEWVRAVMVGFVVATLWCVVYFVVALLILGLSSIFVYIAYGLRNIPLQEWSHQPELGIVHAILNWFLSIPGVGISTILGLAQWVPLRRYLPNAQDLIVSNIIASLVFQATAMLVAYATAGANAFEGQAGASTLIAGWIVTLCLSGTITGFTLVRLLQPSNYGVVRSTKSLGTPKF